MRKSAVKKYKLTLKDVILGVVFILLVALNAWNHIRANQLNDLSGLITGTLILMMSFVGFVNISSYMGWTICVPDFFQLGQDKEREKEIQDVMNQYFEQDINYFHTYDEHKISYIMTQLGIGIHQLDEIRPSLIKMRCIPLRNMDDARERLNCLLKSGPPIIINQKSESPAKVVYDKVDYFINFNDMVFIETYVEELSYLLSFLMTETEKDGLSKIDRIVIPHDSNFLLGVAVGERLRKPIVKMRSDQGRVIKEQYWDGTLKATDRVIIIHDVLVTAQQVIDDLDKLKGKCFVCGLYCLITRKEWNGVEALKKKKIKVHRIADINDDDIRKIQGEPS